MAPANTVLVMNGGRGLFTSQRPGIETNMQIRPSLNTAALIDTIVQDTEGGFNLVPFGRRQYCPASHTRRMLNARDIARCSCEECGAQ
jgi:hypothetical protein